MEDSKARDLSKIEDVSCRMMAVCGYCRHHEKNPTIEFNFGDYRVYWLCQSCKKMNEMDFSKQVPSGYPKTRRM